MKTATALFALAVIVSLQFGVSATAEVIELEGTIRSVDITARTVTIERKTPSGPKTLTLEVAKKAGDVADLRPGSPISFAYDPDLEIVTKIASERAVSNGTAASFPQGKRVPGRREEEVCREVVQALEKEHYLQPRIDSEICSQMMDSFVRSLDPLKSYLRQEDIDAFFKNKQAISRQIRDGDLTAFYALFNRFTERVSAQTPVTRELLAIPPDFNKQETIVTNRELGKWPTNDVDARDQWRRRIKYDMLVLKMSGLSGSDATEKLLRRYTSFGARMEQLSNDELLELILTSLTTSADAKSTYMSGESLKSFEIGQAMQLDGIGAQLKSEDGHVIVVELTSGGAAEKDGRLKPNDQIVGIGQGVSGEIEDIENMSLNRVVGLVRGERGTTVRLQVLPGGRGTPRVYEITRSKIELNTLEVTAEVLSVERAGEKALRVGVIATPSFYLDTAAQQRGDKKPKSIVQDCKSLLDGFRLQNVDCVVIDVRNNGGGPLPTAIGMVGLFIERGRVAQARNHEGKISSLDDNDPDVTWAGPLVVLTNRNTGGSAEIFAGAIQDHHRGIIVGDTRTSGSHTWRKFIPLPDKERDGALTITAGAFYRPTGNGFEQRGMRSDVVLPCITDHLNAGDQRLAHAAGFDRVPNAGFEPVRKEDPSLVTRLQRLSEARVKKSSDFQQATARIDRYLEQQRSGEISLVEAEFVKAWQQASVRDAAADRTPPGIVRDFYLDEVLSLAADLVKADGGK